MPRRQARRARGTGGARAVWPASAVCALFAAGCYEIPPVIPEGYVGSPAATGWPPPAAYAPDALDPRNRWLQRAFAPRDERGALLPLHADEPFSHHERPRRVDLAELAALLERVLDGGTEWPDRIASAAFRSDALAE
ncbi:MAG: hypothetical protein HY721_08500, partial [Planctomycetes bacterium]|nr:hypothetical protein [Planctomycetota bacterium]